MAADPMSFLSFFLSLPEQQVAPYRDAAMAELRAVRVQSSVARLALDAEKAEVLDQSETVAHVDRRIEALYLTQIVRTPAGEYFLLKTTGKRPFVKHLTQAMARHLLGSRYRPPEA